MNEQAIQTMYQLAQAEGYNNSIDDFIALMGSNPEAVQAMYSIAKTEGYNNSIEDFSTLMGVKKKKTLWSRSLLWKRLLRSLPQLQLLNHNKNLEIRILLR